MCPQPKYKEEIIEELQDIPDEDMPKLLEIIHYLKAGIKESRKRVKIKSGREPLLDLRNIAVETGIADLAEHHDHYLYGASK
ncbi:MAG: hypothetical protein HY350_04365 [Candidatus Omnitrophica bacterium]|nr:hypothetical protein [Candidatus Omnitrophota bacterium]